MIKLFWSLFLGFVFMWSGAAQELKQTPHLTEGKLGNGLTYYIYPNDFPKDEAVFRLFIKAGPVLEEDDQKGLAHFLEHMAFNGTQNFPDNGLIQFLERKGAKFGVDFNAHTSLNETVYKLSMSLNEPGILDSSLMVLSDIAGRLTLDSLDIEDERGVIVSEWLSQTGPKRDAQEAFLMELLNGSRYSERLTIGDTAVIKHFPHQRLRDYYEKWYSPNIMAVAVVGDVDVKETEALLQKHFGDLECGLAGELPEFLIPDFAEVGVRRVSHESLNKIEFNIIQLTDRPSAVVNEEDYKNYLQRQLLNQLIRGRFGTLSFNHPDYKSGSYSVGGFINAKGVLMGSAELVPGKVYEGMKAYMTRVEQLFRYGFVPLEIDKVKTRYLNSLRDKTESKSPTPSSSYMDELYAAFYVGHKFVTRELEYQLAKKYIKEIDSLALVQQLQELRAPEATRFLVSYFDQVGEEIPSDETIMALYDSLQTADIAPFELDYELYDELLEKKPRKRKLKELNWEEDLEAHHIRLKNGAEVIYKYSERDRNRIVFSGFREGGLFALDSTDYVNGLVAGRLATLSGAGRFSRESLSHYLADKTVSMLFLIEKTRSGLVGNADHQNVEELFQLLYLRWTQPRAEREVFEQIKEQSIEKYLTENKTATDTFYRDLGLLINGDSYTRRELSDSLLNNELSYERMLPVFNQNFGSARGYKFVILGDMPFEEIKPLIERYIGGLPGGKVDTGYRYSGPVLPEAPLVFERAVGDSPRATVSLMFQSTEIEGDMDRYKLVADMTQSVLRTRLLQTLREEMGMVYSVGVSTGSTMHPSVLRRSTIRFASNPDDVDALIDRTKQELELLAGNPDLILPILADVKLNMIQKWTSDQQRNMFWSRSIRNSLFNKEDGWDSFLKYDQWVESVTAEDVAAAIYNDFIATPVIKVILNPKPEVK